VTLFVQVESEEDAEKLARCLRYRPKVYFCLMSHFSGVDQSLVEGHFKEIVAKLNRNEISVF